MGQGRAAQGGLVFWLTGSELLCFRDPHRLDHWLTSSSRSVVAGCSRKSPELWKRGRGSGMVLTPLALDLALNLTVFNLARSFFSTLQTDGASAGEGLDQQQVHLCVCVWGPL